MWIWWAGAALALAAVEVVSTDLVFLMLAGGALAGSGAAALGVPVWGQFAVFALVAIALMLLARPPAESLSAGFYPQYANQCGGASWS